MTDARVTQEAVLILHGGATSDARVTQEAILVLHNDVPPVDVNISQAAVQVLTFETNPEVKIYQSAVQVLASEDNPEVGISQAAVQVLLGPPPSITTSEEYNNFPLYTSDGTTIAYISGTYDYTILVGSNLNTATYFSSGTTTFTDGVCEIVVSASGMLEGDSAILVVQKDESIGVYPAIVSAYWGA